MTQSRTLAGPARTRTLLVEDQGMFRALLWLLALIALGVVGLVFLAGGAADALDAAMACQGMGFGKMIVGGALIVFFVTAMAINSATRKR